MGVSRTLVHALLIFALLQIVLANSSKNGPQGIRYEAEDAHITGRGEVIRVVGDDEVSGAGYAVLGTKLSGAPSKAIFVCNIAEDGEYPLAYAVHLKHLSKVATALNVYANGHHMVQSTVQSDGWALKTEKIRLRRGVNSIFYESVVAEDVVAIDYIIVEGAIPLAARGATLPYVEIEAENAKYTGKLIGPNRAYTTLPSEASGRLAVQITGDQTVDFPVTTPTNGIVIRFSIPDAPQGQGQNGILGIFIDGQKWENVPITSHFSWAYGAAYPQPAGSLSIIDYGADPTGKKDSTDAINSAITAGQNDNKVVWIPAGNFTVHSRFTINKAVTIRGAGPWYSYVWGTVNHGVGFGANWNPSPQSAYQLYDFSIIGDTNDRDDGAIDSGITGSPQGVIAQNLWIEHVKCGAWVDGPFGDFSVIGTTIRNTFADDKGVTNSVVQQSIFRNTGDDAFAAWSEQQADKNNVVKFNTVQVAVLANGIAIYGGSDNQVTDNYVADTICQGSGLHAGNRYNSAELQGTTLFARNTIVRGGGQAADNSSWNGGIWFWAQEHNIVNPINVVDTEIINSTWSAILFWGAGTTISGVTLSNVTVDGATTYGLEIQGPVGSVKTDRFVVKNTRWAQYCSYEKEYQVISGAGNSFNTTSGCVAPY